MTDIRIGTSGWNYPHWAGRFYPKGLARRDWFAHYAEQFDTVEINNTFYRLPSASTVESWAEQAPSGFLYAVKASRFLTHFKHLKDAEQPLDKLGERIERLGSHLGPVLYQLPGRWHADTERLEAFCAALPGQWRHVVEFRDKSWLIDDVYQILDRHGVSVCVHDALEEHPNVQIGPLAYVRLHGPSERRAKYSAQELDRWGERVSELADSAREAYVYFNNDYQGYAPDNARSLQRLLGVRQS